jgi:Tfp pilus assembly protein PilO
MIQQVLAAVPGEPSWGDLAVLGTYALALIAGYYGAYRFQVLHEREQKQLERARADQEREERRESETRERKTQEAALPALQEAVRAMDQVSRMLDRQSRP